MDGVFRHVEQLARYFLDGGARVDLAYSSARRCADLDRLVEEIDARGGATLDLEVGNAPCVGDVRALLRLRRFARQHKPVVIHAHSSKAGVLVRALRLLGEDATLLYTPHAYYGADPQGHPARAFLFNAIEWAAGHCGISISLNEAEARFARERLHIQRKRLRIIPNGVDPEAFRPATPREKAELRRARGIPEDAIVLGTVGRANAQKDPLTLYQAVIRALRANHRLHFYHLGWKGNADLMEEVAHLLAEAGVADRVHQDSYSSDPAPAYRLMDGFVMASRYEGMSYVILEAMTSGLPLILTKAEGNLYLRDYPLTELSWAEIGDVESLTGAINTWVRRGHFAPCAQHRMVAESHFSNRSSCRRIAFSYAQAVLGRRVHAFARRFRTPLPSASSSHHTYATPHA